MEFFKRFSEKQRLVLRWWDMPCYRAYDAIICDGAVRSGKTFSMSLSFVLWAMAHFNAGNFALCGKTITSLRRNVITPLLRTLDSLGFPTKEFVSKNRFTVTCGACTNHFYLFGGKDESSAALIQGITLSGLLLDEVALMPRSFVEQAVARCSVDGSKLWFNCNPEGPHHWFKKEWIDKAAAKNALYVHFALEDNPALSRRIIRRYHNLYSGAFYERYVLGKWTATSGLVYPMFRYEAHTFSPAEHKYSRYAVSCDYGTVNPASFGLWGESGGVWYRIAEYYYNSRTEGAQRTDEEHYAALEALCGNRRISAVVCDPSASSFLECIRRHGKFPARAAENDVLSGIRRVADALNCGRIKISRVCTDAIREFSLYRWDEKSGTDAPVKENDHAMDDIRYFVSAFLREKTDNFFALSLDRTGKTP